MEIEISHRVVVTVPVCWLPVTMANLITHLTYQFLPPIISSVLANVADRVLAPQASFKKPVENGRKTGLQRLGLEWRSGPPGSDGWRRNRVVS